MKIYKTLVGVSVARIDIFPSQEKILYETLHTSSLHLSYGIAHASPGGQKIVALRINRTHRKIPGVDILSNQRYSWDHGGAAHGAISAATIVTGFTVY